MKYKWVRSWLSILLCVALMLPMFPVASAAAPATLKSVTLNSALSMKVGETTNLAAKVTMSDNSAYTITNDTQLPQGMKVTWEVEDNRDDEVRVTQDPVHPLQAELNARTVAASNEPNKEVSVTVTVRMGGDTKTATCKVMVQSAEPAGVTITPNSLELVPGSTGTLKATVKPDSAPQQVTWASKNPDLAKVDANGKVTAGQTPGQTQITATSTSNVASCTVTVLGIALKETSLTLWERQNHTLQYDIFGSQLQERQVEWISSNNQVVTVSKGYLYALKEGTATITAKIQGTTYTATCTVEVKRNTADVITASVDAGEPISLSTLRSSIQAQCTKVLGASLSYVNGFTVTTSQGTLYYRYQSESDTGYGVGTSERYYVTPPLGQRALDDVTFVPKADFSGTAVINYTGYAGETQFFQGTIEITVAEQEDIVYTTASNKALQFNAADFNRLCRNRTGRDLDTVSFSLPDSSRGTLYYRYSAASSYNTKVNPAKEYRANGTPSLGDVYFVPASGFSGEVIISFQARDVNNTSFRGRMRIQVSKTTSTGDINYTIGQGGWVTLDDDDFDDLCRDATGYGLSYVRLQLPSASQGTLYYNYTATSGAYTELVSADRNYYLNSTPYLRRITFVAAKSWIGTVEIPFRAWDTKGNQFTGVVNIVVESATGGNIRYTAYQGGKANFDDVDFNNLSLQLTGSTLSYVQFQLPSSSQGTLYYNYTSSSSYDSQVTSSRKYYRASSPYIDKVSFVPKSTFSGTATVAFTGWNIAGKSFTGTVAIDVSGTVQQITYRVNSGGAVRLNLTDFDALCAYHTGDPLRYVRFTLPSSSRGTLYYDYNATNGNYSSKVTSYTNYYNNTSPYLERVYFVANSSYTGTMELEFTGWSTGGTSFKGTVKIVVSAPPSPSVLYYTATSSGTATFRGSDFTAACAVRGLGSLTSVRFTLPSATQGALYYRYTGTQSGSTAVQSTTYYYPSTTPSLSEVTFVAAAGFKGTATVYYTGTDTLGNTYQGQIRIAVQTSLSSRYFNDLGNYSWAVSSVDLLYEQGIVTGTGNGRYSPQNSISRGDFMLMLDRMYDFPAASGTGFSDVPVSSYYGAAIGAAKALGIATGYGDGTFRPNAPISRQDAMLLLKRAMVADGWSLGAGDTSLLWSFKDGSQVAPYAADAMASMVYFGIVAGNDDNMLRPTANMSRAEMAVVLARVLAL